ncbi:colony stimulating factor 3 (granulocyte) b [Pygocentrus nattereri]|uniref:colony stimulating factor 3 (granulocyte) b n=1 Tax=Pygocentrus nattereri TaxID=42514 RepID=UPI001890B8B2|nr:colony stimulating factor 3 (granulocyte) b [Pygocentrus nattereri]
MSPLLIAALLCSLLAVSISAPVQFSPQEGFSQHMELAKSFTKKLLSEIPTVHHSCVGTEGLSLEPSAEVKNLEYIMAALAIPAAPRLAPISETHTPAMSLGRISEGLQLHQHLLQEVKKKLKCSEKLTPLLADLRDLSAQVHKLQQEAQLTPSEPQAQSSSLSSRLTGDYEVQVATHLVLQQLRSFGQDVFRSLRHIFTQSALGA